MKLTTERRAVPLTGIQIFWAICAVIGLIGVGAPATHAPDAAAFLVDLGRNWSAVTVSMDLLLLGLAAVAFAVIEARRLKMPWPWIWIALAIPLPGAFLIPLFFLLRERAVIRIEAERRCRGVA